MPASSALRLSSFLRSLNALCKDFSSAANAIEISFLMRINIGSNSFRNALKAASVLASTSSFIAVEILGNKVPSVIRPWMVLCWRSSDPRPKVA